MIPKDPIILLSFVNMKLRDNYKDLDALAEGLDISSDELSEIVSKLKEIGYEYSSDRNQFV